MANRTVTVRITLTWHAPAIDSLTATINSLWPPNHQLVPITVTDSFSGGCGTVACAISSAASSEPVDPGGDWVFNGLALELRAERLDTRAGNTNGRIG